VASTLGGREGQARSMAYGSGCAGRTLLRRYDSLEKIRLQADMFMCSDVVMKAVATEIMTDPPGGSFHYTNESGIWTDARNTCMV
jgi:hypothetical protein